LGRYEEADELATTSEQATARSWIAAQVTWRGVRALLLAQRGEIEAGERLAREAVELALRTDRVDTQTAALMDLVEVLLVAGRREEAIPIVIDALERYERKEVLPAAARARALLDELTAGTAASVGS
jgi:ATP/maltotriose-dependent transcriptional regulator MalT